MTRGAFFLILALVVFAGIGAITTGPQSAVRQPSVRFDELLTLLEAEVDRRRDSRESHGDNLRRLALRARDGFETDSTKIDRTESLVPRFDD